MNARLFGLVACEELCDPDVMWKLTMQCLNTADGRLCPATSCLFFCMFNI